MSTEKYQRRYRRGFACCGRILTRFFALWQEFGAFLCALAHYSRATTGFPTHFFCALFACPRCIVYTLRQGFYTFFTRFFMCFGMLVARYGRFFDAFLRAFVLWRIARALRQGFRRIFLRAFYVLWYIGCTPRGGFSTFLRVFCFCGRFHAFRRDPCKAATTGRSK